MIIVLKPSATPREVEHLLARIRELGLSPHVSRGEERTIVGVIGDERVLNDHPISAFPGVESVLPILSPYKLVSREFKKEDTVVQAGGVAIGGKKIAIMAGPCSVEKKDLLVAIAEEVKTAGAVVLRGGAFKPRTSPYTFQGLGREGLEYLAEAKKRTGLIVITEVMDPRDVELMIDFADILQIGARNMQNFTLLKEVGAQRTPVLLKRGMWATIKEFLMAAEYVMAAGNHQVILCERGIRTFETATRNTLDLSAIPVVRQLSHLPIVVDPSHGVGRSDLVAPMAKAAIAVGADGLLIEVHSNPEEAYSDGEQAILPSQFAALMQDLRKIAAAVGREL